MKQKWISDSFIYDGSQLKPLYNYLNYELLGDSIVSWQGPCSVKTDSIVDGEDLIAGSEITGTDMVHFVVEKFECSLLAAVGLQRLMASLSVELLRSLSFKTDATSQLRREGDDVYWGHKKLNISVATKSVNSCLIHFAVNVDTRGTPVATVGLNELGVDVREFAEALMTAFTTETQKMIEATHKVKGLS